jgi:hypothetical protein
MKFASSRGIQSAAVFLAVLMLAAASPAQDQGSAFAPGGDAPVAVNPAFPVQPTANEILLKVLAANKRRNELLSNYTVTRTYAIRNREGKLGAQTIARMEYRAPDVKTFDKTSEEGSGIVRHLVFDRLMDSEKETASGKEHHDSALTPANYSFYLIGQEDLGPYHCFVLQAVPKRKDKYLFEGTIWVESHDFAIARIEGHPAKKLSFWVNRADFVREYQKVDDFWLPLRDVTHIDVKIYGERVLTIDHGPYVLPPEVKRQMESVN